MKRTSIDLGYVKLGGFVKTKRLNSGEFYYYDVDEDRIPIMIKKEVSTGYYHVFLSRINGYIVKMIRINGQWWDLERHARSTYAYGRCE